MTTPLLLIEDTPSLQMVYRSVLTSAGHAVRVAATAADGLAAFTEVKPSVVLLDLVLPDRDGLDLMADMLAQRPEVHVIVITANGSINKAVEAMRAGAHDFLVKPFDETRFLGAVDNALTGRPPAGRAARPAPRPRAAPATASPASDAFIGASEAMERIHAKIRSVARSMATVFITGESGTGKELCALAVHDNSARASGPFIALNCGAIPQDLLESEVFGHVKGSFTGAISDKPGAAAAADGGTLFLDEICEMAPALQTKLLRFLQTSTVQPVGATRPRKVNVRIVCATNQDPLEAVRRGRFREDLYYRLFVVPIHMPPLRERGEDVIEIARAALQRFSAEEGRNFTGFSPEVETLFLRHPWPGNVRQLLNVIRHVVVLNDGGLVTPAMLPESLPRGLEAAAPEPERDHAAAADPTRLGDLIGRPLAEVERLLIEATLARCNGSVPKAARMLELSPSTLYRKIEGWKDA
ncbi:sigma-54-dependent transcriptional regulator [Paragemmobacter straminiformis]|uniref:Nif-specific regulatory protein n=1 Tax=Paragemmobacter straminiformis TaxID=2045119 RepID=A0A842I3L7_9RHOB|nr:sigma-54 dependent transcriptional regulator [Gemmobacter straminiformis]MBC2834125.1 sigma-54-dependent Fis family transcriptional regulator [Gemmobacter straminiformis]